MGGRRLFEGQLSALVLINSLRKIIAPLAKVWLYFLIRSLYVSYLLNLTAPPYFSKQIHLNLNRPEQKQLFWLLKVKLTRLNMNEL